MPNNNNFGGPGADPTGYNEFDDGMNDSPGDFGMGGMNLGSGKLNKSGGKKGPNKDSPSKPIMYSTKGIKKSPKKPAPAKPTGRTSTQAP